MTCPEASFTELPAIIPLFGNTTFYQLSQYLGGACAILSTSISLFLIMRHATHFSIPAEQTYIIRLTSLIIWFAIVAWLSIEFEAQAKYLAPLFTFYESFCFVSFFLLLCAWISPDPEERDRYFQNIEFRKNDQVKEGGHLLWFHNRWILVFQFPAVTTIITIVTEITQATNAYCVLSKSPKYAHIWCVVIQAISTAVAVTGTLGFYRRVKTDIASHRPILKLVALKIIVFLIFVQSLLFSFLITEKQLVPTKYLSISDISVGLPALVIDIETVFYSLFFLYAYRVGPYILPKPDHSNSNSISPTSTSDQATLTDSSYSSYQGGPLGLRAIWCAINILDVIRGIFHGPQRLLNKVLGSEYDRNLPLKPLNGIPLKGNPGDGQIVSEDYHPYAPMKNGRGREV